jgi:hypothetical protein
MYLLSQTNTRVPYLLDLDLYLALAWSNILVPLADFTLLIVKIPHAQGR